MDEYRPWLKMHLPDHWWEDQIHVPWRIPCTIRVLMVSDGATFGPEIGYALSRVLEALRHDLPAWVRIEVTTARHASGPGAADIGDLRFDAHDLEPYDQIWLFGVGAGNAYRPGELTALWEFMQGGGGVFATGDHEALGEGLCARIPRVRSMRRWYYPAPGPNGEPVAPARDVGGGRGEKDTTTTPAGSDFDGVPQTIRPVMYGSAGPFVWVTRERPHPILCGGSGIVTVLPDHMHEGVIEVPADLAMPITVDGTPVDEYPRRGADRLPPEVIAHSSINNNPAGSPFGVIGAYDGHQVDEIGGGVGRVVVDATWHHFWNMNVEQFASAHDVVRDAAAKGIPAPAVAVAPAHAWEQIRDYFQNIAFWLARRSTQDCIRRRGLWLVSHHVDVLMALRSAQLDRVGHLIDLGTKARDALQQIAPNCERLRFVLDIPVFEEFIPWRLPDPPDPPWRWQIPFLDGSLVEDLALGAQIEAIAGLTARATSPKQVEKVLNGRRFDAALSQAAAESFILLGDRLRGDAGRLDRIAGRRAAAE